MTKQELLQAIRDNWFSTDEDLVDFIFDALPELKDPPILPIIKCKECKYAIIITNEIGERRLACNIEVPTLVEPEYFCARGERVYKMPEIEEMKKAADKFFIGGDEE